MKKIFFLQKLQIANGLAHLHSALIVIITNFRDCWEHLTSNGKGQVFLLFFFFPWKHNRNELQSSSN